MQEQENMSGNEQANIAGQAMESMGIPTETANEAETLEGGVKEVNDDPHGIKKRLGQQAKKHAREMRLMQEQVQAMQSQMQPQAQEPEQHHSFTGQPQGEDVNSQINMAVAAALRAKDEHEHQMATRKAEQEQREHMSKQYQALDEHFDKASEKYDDFDDVVRHHDAPFTSTMRDYALTLDNPADVLYKLGKNPDELKRISKLPAIQQAKEMSKLSFALMGGTKAPEVHSKPMGQIKGNPVASHAVTEKTSVSDIRSRMKSGGWK